MKGLEELLKRSANYISGIPAAPGLAIGKSFIFKKENLLIGDNYIEDVVDAVIEFANALERSKKELYKVFGIAKEKMGEKRAAIFEAQLMILDDEILIKAIKDRIRKEKREPAFIVNDEFSRYQQLILLSKEPLMRERAADIEDIKMRIIRNLQKKRWESKIEDDVMVVSDLLTPADMILFSRKKINGFITDFGGLTSHAAIIARSLDIPAVVGLHNATEKIHQGDETIIDGFSGIVFINPTDFQKEYYAEKIETMRGINLRMQELRDKKAETLDGHQISLNANIDIKEEIQLLLSNNADGIGLYRTEQLLEELNEFPDEEKQTEIYLNIAANIYPKKATIRAFDLGGDKLRLFNHSEQNPFLGLRGIRFLLDNQGIFISQIKAILRAGIHKNLQFMIPMVSTIEEIREFKRLITNSKNELIAEGKPFDDDMKLGIMLEVPSAAVMTKDYAREVDFISIGTNDLIQYLMAVDRGNDLVHNLYQEFHPAVLRTLAHIVNGAKSAGVPVAICGEMAADNFALPFLIGIGMDSISVSPAALPSVKKTIRSLSMKNAQALAERLLQLPTTNEIVAEVEKFFTINQIQRTRNIL